MIADPPVREDGRCAACFDPRKFPKRPPHPSIDPLMYERDPFCRMSCARAWHGIPPTLTIGGHADEQRGRYERLAA